MNWSEVDDMTVRKLFMEDELSFRQIAAKFTDATIGKVAGRCRRLGLQRGTSPMRGVKRSEKRAEEIEEDPLPPPPRQPQVREEPARPGSMKFIELDAEACRFPFGDPRHDDFGFCGMTKLVGSPYCADHKRVAHVFSGKKGH